MLVAGLWFIDIYKNDKKFNIWEDYSSKSTRFSDKVGSKLEGICFIIHAITIGYQWIYKVKKFHYNG
jgi:hypothetical protein